MKDPPAIPQPTDPPDALSPGVGAAAGRAVAVVTPSAHDIDPDAPGRLGVDYAFPRPSSPQALKDTVLPAPSPAPCSFVVRYLSHVNPRTIGKILTKEEADGLLAVGLDIVSNYEYGPESLAELGDYQEGASNAREAMEQAAAAGAPADRPIYFSVDWDASEGELSAIGSYFDGVASVMGGVARVGAYGSFTVIKGLFDAGKIQWGWQCQAWSHKQWDSRAQLRQIENFVAGIAGMDSCDIDQAMAGDFGQWGPPPSAVQAPDASKQAQPVGDPVASAQGAAFHLDQAVEHGVVAGPKRLLVAVAHPACLHTGGQSVVTGSNSIYVGGDQSPLAGEGDQTEDGGVIGDRSDDKVYMT